MKRLLFGMAALALLCIVPAATASETQFGFVPYKVAVKELPPGYTDFVALRDEDRRRQVLKQNVLCDQWPQVISLVTRIDKGDTMKEAIDYMASRWDGKRVCRARTVTVTPTHFAVRGGKAEDNIDVFILAWTTDDGRMLFNGINAEQLKH